MAIAHKFWENNKVGLRRHNSWLWPHFTQSISIWFGRTNKFFKLLQLAGQFQQVSASASTPKIEKQQLLVGTCSHVWNHQTIGAPSPSLGRRAILNAVGPFDRFKGVLLLDAWNRCGAHLSTWSPIGAKNWLLATTATTTHDYDIIYIIVLFT